MAPRATSTTGQHRNRRWRSRRGPRPKPLTIAELHEALQATTERTLRRDRLERDERGYRWVMRKAFAEGLCFRSSIAQAARGMGYESHGNRHQDFYRWESSVRRTLDSLQAAGLLQWGGVKREDGRWHCIEVRVLDQPTSSPTGRSCGPRRPLRRPLGTLEGDRRRPHRAASSARRVFFAKHEVVSPLRGVGFPSETQPLDSWSRARARPVATAAPASTPAAAEQEGGSAAASARQSPGEQQQVAARGAPAPRRSVVRSAARASLEARFAELFAPLLRPLGATPAAPGRVWAERLERALGRLDRYANFGAGADGAGLSFALAHMEADVEEVRWSRRRKVPRSVAYYVPLLEEVSKQWRRQGAERLATSPAEWRPTWANPKKKRRRRGGGAGADERQRGG